MTQTYVRSTTPSPVNVEDVIVDVEPEPDYDMDPIPSQTETYVRPSDLHHEDVVSVECISTPAENTERLNHVDNPHHVDADLYSAVTESRVEKDIIVQPGQEDHVTQVVVGYDGSKVSGDTGTIYVEVRSGY